MPFVANPDGMWFRHFHPQDLVANSYHRVLIEQDREAINAPVFAISGALSREPIHDIIHMYWYQRANYITMTVNGGILAAATTLVVDHNGANSTDGIVPGMQFMNFATREIMRVASVTNGTTLELVRAVGNVVAADIADDTVLVFVGTNYPQASQRPEAQGFPASRAVTYTSIIRSAWSVSGTEESIKKHVGWMSVSRSQKECFFQHAVDAEMTMLFSQGVAPAGVVNDRTATVGFEDSIYQYGDPALNIVTLGTTTTYAQLRTAMEYAFDNSSQYTSYRNRVLFVDNLAMAVLDDLGKNYVGLGVPSQDTSMFGMTFNKMRTYYGDIMIKHHKLLQEMVSPASPGYALLMDLPSMRYGYLPGREQVYEKFNGIKDSTDTAIDAHGGGYLSELAFMNYNPHGNAIIDGWTAAA